MLCFFWRRIYKYQYKEFSFFLIGLNSIVSTLPQSEYTSRAVYSSLCLFLSIVYSVFQRCPTRHEIYISSRPIKLQKKVKIFKNFEITKFYKIFKNFKNSYTISKLSKNFKIIKFNFFY